MFRASLKGVWQHKLRLALTVVAIVLGISLVSGVYVLTDTIGRAFDGIFKDAFVGIDIFVSAESDFSFSDRAYVDEDIIDGIADVDGVDEVFPFISGIGVAILDQEGELLGQVPGPPTFVQSITPNDLGGFLIAQGEFPDEPGEIALDRPTAELGEFAIGDNVSIISETEGRFSMTLVGIAGFGEEDNLGGARFVLGDVATSQTLLGREGVLSGAAVQVEPGATVESVIATVTSQVPEYVSVLDGQSAAEAEAADIQQGLAFFTNFLAAFGFIALFAGALLIYNTFQIVVRQRTRELALMRALGATRRQVNLLVVFEALIIGTVGATVGLLAGFGIAAGIQGIFEAIGIDLPTTSLTLLPRTVIVAYVAGVGITLVSSILPARRASKVAVMAALRDDPQQAPGASFLRRLLGGAVGLGAGLASLFFGLFGDVNTASPILWVGLGAALIFIGVFVLTPFFARQFANFLGRPFEAAFGTTGRLARGNSMRSPKQTAATAVAVTLSITLVALASVLVASIQSTIDDIIGNDIAADVLVSPTDQFNAFAAFTPEIAASIAAEPDVATVTRTQVAPVRYLGNENFIAGSDESFIDAFPPADLEGSLALEPGSLLVQRSIAEADGLMIGSTVEFLFEGASSPATFTVSGIDDAQGWPAPLVISTEDIAANIGFEADSFLYVNGVDGVDPDDLKSTVEAVIDDLPTIRAQTLDEVRSEAASAIQGLLNFILGLLAITVLIGLLGVTNTMVLAVSERKREIGLLRAVGLDRRSTRRMVRSEAAIVALFGAILGVALGIFFGWAVVRALADDGLSFAISWLPSGFTLSGILGSLVFWIIATGVLGIAFAVFPARRAARLNVLEAIAYE